MILSNRPGFLLLQLFRETVLLHSSSRSNWDERLPNKGPTGSSSGAKRFAEIGLELGIEGLLPTVDLCVTELVLMFCGLMLLESSCPDMARGLPPGLAFEWSASVSILRTLT